MTDTSKIDDLRRRLDADPASIAFAQLAEEYRRAGQLRESVETCRAGLARHPDYLSARITLARSLFALDELDQAEQELMLVLRRAPDSLAAVRGLGEIHYRRGSHREALACYEAALTLAWNDPDLEQAASQLRRLVAESVEAVTPVTSVPHVAPMTLVPKAAPALDDRALRTIAALEGWLAAITHHVARTQSRA